MSYKFREQLVSLKQVVIVDGTSLRTISEDAVSRYMETYAADENKSKPSTKPELDLKALPPVLLLLFQGVRPSEALYGLVDGRHRFESLNRLRSPKLLANTIYDPSFTVHDMDSPEVRRFIKLEGLRANLKHGLYLSMDQRRAIIEDLYFQEKIPIEELSLLGIPPRTLYRWFGEAQKASKEKLIERAKELHGEGHSHRAITEMLKSESGDDELSHSTVTRWLVSPGENPSSGAFLPDGKNAPLTTGPSLPLTPLNINIAEAQERAAKELAASVVDSQCQDANQVPEDNQAALKCLEQLRDQLCDIPVTASTGHYIAVEILPILSASFPEIAALVADRGYALKYEELSVRYEELLGRHNKVADDKIAVDEKLREAQYALRERADNCDHRCTHIISILASKYEEFLDAAYTDLGFLLDNNPDNTAMVDRCAMRIISSGTWFTMNSAPTQSVMEKVYAFERYRDGKPNLFSREIHRRAAKLIADLEAARSRATNGGAVCKQ